MKKLIQFAVCIAYVHAAWFGTKFVYHWIADNFVPREYWVIALGGEEFNMVEEIEPFRTKELCEKLISLTDHKDKLSCIQGMAI